MSERGAGNSLSRSATPAALGPRGGYAAHRTRSKTAPSCGQELLSWRHRHPRWDSGGWGSLQCVLRAHGSLALSCRSKEGPPQAGPGGRTDPRTGTQPGTYQLQRAETDERAAPGAAAHGVAGVPAARLQRGLRAQSALSVTPEQPALRFLTARRLWTPRLAFGLQQSGWGSPPPLLICTQGRRRSVRCSELLDCRGSLPPSAPVCFLGRGSRAGGRGTKEATAGEWVNAF